MPALNFGKYKGCDVRDVPSDYLEWALRTIEWFRPEQRTAIEAELRRRDGPSEPPPRQTDRVPAFVTASAASAIVTAGRRALAKIYHPDLGGDTKKMTEINATADWLEKITPRFLGGR